MIYAPCQRQPVALAGRSAAVGPGLPAGVSGADIRHHVGTPRGAAVRWRSHGALLPTTRQEATTMECTVCSEPIEGPVHNEERGEPRCARCCWDDRRGLHTPCCEAGAA